MTLLVFLTALGTSSGQSYSMSTDNCTITPNVITFDVMMTNSGPADMHINSTVIRMNHGTALLPTAGVNTVSFSYVNDGQSVMPLSFPPNASPTFSYTAASRQWQVSTGTSIYLNGSCTAPLVEAGQTVKLGRFALSLSNSLGNTFNPGAQAQLTFHTTAAMVIYLNCNSVTSLASALTKTLIAPCALTVPSSCAITASIQSQIDVLCFGGTGSATATSTGGVEPVTYSWNTTPVQSTATASNLAPGTYVVTATGANACTATASVTIAGPSAELVASGVQGAPILCNGGSSSVTVSATGGTPPYSGTGNFPVTAGPYAFTVTDANGCTSVASGTVSEPSALTSSASATPTSTPSGSDGTATVSVNGGTPPYTITWDSSPAQSGASATGLAAGTYTASVVDANGCSTSASATVTSPTCALVASSSQGAAILCFGGTTTVTVSQTGGVEPVSGTGTFTVGAGTYTYTVTDNIGCTSSTTITVSEPSQLVASSSATAIACFGGSSSVTVSATGGTAPYTGTGSFSEVAGTYTYTVTDGNGCTASTSVTTLSQLS